MKNALDTYTCMPLWKHVYGRVEGLGDGYGYGHTEDEYGVTHTMHSVRGMLVRGHYREAFDLLVPLLQTVQEYEKVC
ncbi:hypothetical protein EON63_16430 [archaeon]|nr:MAG: hypothetical protein EON63_16430 [archaeon]